MKAPTTFKGHDSRSRTLEIHQEIDYDEIKDEQDPDTTLLQIRSIRG